MNLLKLRLSMLGTLALIVSASTLFFTVMLTWMGAFNLYTMLIFVVGFNILQWLIAPYMIGALYHAREVKESENPSLYRMVRNICQRTGLEMPRLMLANIPIPNAFAYGSPIAGKRLAVTSGLMGTLEEEEVEAVLGHEIGHLKHRDVQIMMFASVLPAIFYYIGNSLMWSSFLGGNRERNSGAALAIAFASIAIYWILTLLVLNLSRLREYYADQHAVQYVPDGARKLSEGLAKISTSSAASMRRGSEGRSKAAGTFKSLFISDPDHAVQDVAAISGTWGRSSDSKLVNEILSREVKGADKFIELLSTHPNIVKRLRALQPKQQNLQ
ncbi:MAG: M48 family metalloprotease [Thaumarchaeota archaeon]|nr:M48 family metalloprotease [Nitrososphaerota archaeon]